jgi:hypothetical protein
MRARRLLLGSLALLAASCFGGDFEAPSKITTVRILASRADKPYAKPGDTVSLEVLAIDGRPDKTRPMQLYWLPFVCNNPQGDLYYACFAGGADLKFNGQLSPDCPISPAHPVPDPGIDLTPCLVTGPTNKLTLASDIITKHPPVEGSVAPYGLAILFNVACAGHLEVTPQDPNDLRKQQVPIGCFDENHVALPPSEYVIGFTRVYAYDSLTNANPVIANATFQGNALGSGEEVAVDHCDAKHRTDCSEQKIGVNVTDDSWEVNPGDSSNSGNAHEQIWADYYITEGDWKSDARLLFDTKAGRVADTDNSLYAPRTAGDGTVFIVVHDNRGGASWTSFPLHVR